MMQKMGLQRMQPHFTLYQIHNNKENSVLIMKYPIYGDIVWVSG